jgi:hypothetical protein
MMDQLSMMQMARCVRWQFRDSPASGRSQHGAGKQERRPHHEDQSHHQPNAHCEIERKRNDATAEQHQGCAEGNGKKAYPDTGRPLGTLAMCGHGDRFVAEEMRIETTSGQLTQIMQAREQAVATGSVPFSPCGAIESGAGPPRGASGAQKTGDITGVGDSLDRRHYQVRREPDETVHQCDGIGEKKILCPQGMDRGHANYLYYERRSNK